MIEYYDLVNIVDALIMLYVIFEYMKLKKIEINL